MTETTTQEPSMTTTDPLAHHHDIAGRITDTLIEYAQPQHQFDLWFNPDGTFITQLSQSSWLEGRDDCIVLPDDFAGDLDEWIITDGVTARHEITDEIRDECRSDYHSAVYAGVLNELQHRQDEREEAARQSELSGQ